MQVALLGTAALAAVEAAPAVAVHPKPLEDLEETVVAVVQPPLLVLRLTSQSPVVAALAL
jgi:hypothetical protein